MRPLLLILAGLIAANSDGTQVVACSHKLQLTPSAGYIQVYANGLLLDTPGDYTIRWGTTPPNILRNSDVPGVWSVIYNHAGVSRRENWSCP